jgi:hypothetical protein
MVVEMKIYRHVKDAAAWHVRLAWRGGIFQVIFAGDDRMDVYGYPGVGVLLYPEIAMLWVTIETSTYLIEFICNNTENVTTIPLFLFLKSTSFVLVM